MGNLIIFVLYFKGESEILYKYNNMGIEKIFNNWLKGIKFFVFVEKIKI